MNNYPNYQDHLDQIKKKKLYTKKLVSLWQRMRFYPVYDMNGNVIGGETVVADEVENLAEKPKNQIPPKT